MNEHTKEPWAVDPDNRDGMEWNNHIVSEKNPHLRICFMAHDGTNENATGEANARRIVACVNACAGIETYALELMTGELLLLNQITHKTRERLTKKAVQYRKQRDALLAALKELAAALDPEDWMGDISMLNFIESAIQKAEAQS